MNTFESLILFIVLSLVSIVLETIFLMVGHNKLKFKEIIKNNKYKEYIVFETIIFTMIFVIFYKIFKCNLIFIVLINYFASHLIKGSINLKYENKGDKSKWII